MVITSKKRFYVTHRIVSMFVRSKTAMKFCVAASVFLSVLQVVYMRIELEDFYPYGPENGDSAVPTNDDGSSGRVNIGFPFPFFDDEHESLFVSISISRWHCFN